jgi:GTPase SAR1 family protein
LNKASGIGEKPVRAPSPPKQYRVAMLGASGVGKSSLTSQFLSSDHMNTYDSVGKFQTRLSVRETNGGQCVERMKEYQQAWQMIGIHLGINYLVSNETK